LPPIQAGEVHPDVPNHRASALTPLNLQRLQATPPGGTRADWPEELTLKCHQNHRGHSDVYGRMRADSQAPVLTTKCTSISNGRFGHPYQDRPISVREAACLQTFPQDFVFEGSIKSSTRQVGNAVPVLLAQRMGMAFRSHVDSASDQPQTVKRDDS
jgi:DNA (cytosine-5)-methyltransferase 1